MLYHFSATHYCQFYFVSRSECKDQLHKLAQVKLHKYSLNVKDTTTASTNTSNLIKHMEKSVRAAKKAQSRISVENFATFGDFFLHIPEAIVKEMVKKHKFEEEVFFLLCNTICETQIYEVAILV